MRNLYMQAYIVDKPCRLVLMSDMKCEQSESLKYSVGMGSGFCTKTLVCVCVCVWVCVDFAPKSRVTPILHNNLGGGGGIFWPKISKPKI